jgi:lysozyme family protein
VLITKYIQQILNINVDGKFGIISLQSLLSSSNNKSIFDALYQKRKDRYAAIIKNNPSQKTFERGWENRLNAIKYSI